VEVTSTVPASATVTLAAVQAGLLVIDPWEVASLPNCLNRCWFPFLIKRLFDLRLWCLLRGCMLRLVCTFSSYNKSNATLHRPGKALRARGV